MTLNFHNEKFANAVQLKAQNVPPIWFMRQAGRYHSHYQALRAKHSFDELCKVPELAAETALGPIEDFDFDVSILFSDLLYPLEALGMGLEYTDKGPQLGFQLNAQNLKQLKPWDEAIGFMEFQGQSVKATRERLPKDKSLIGFVGSPWTLFVYAVEGTHKGHIEKAKSSLGFYGEYCQSLVPFLKENIRFQLDAGAEVVMLFDTAAGALHPTLFEEYVLPGLKEIVKAHSGRIAYYIKESTPGHLVALQRGGVMEPLAGVGYDHRWSLPEVLKDPGRNHYVQGNFDQAMLLTDVDSYKMALKLFIEQMRSLSPEERKGWVCGLGHGILPKVPEDYVRIFVDEVRKAFA